MVSTDTVLICEAAHRTTQTNANQGAGTDRRKPHPRKVVDQKLESPSVWFFCVPLSIVKPTVGGTSHLVGAQKHYRNTHKVGTSRHNLQRRLWANAIS